MHSLRILLFTLFSIIALTPTNAQETERGMWYMYFGNNRVAPNLNWHNEIQYRNYDWGSDLEQLLIRTGVGRNLSENNNNLLLGYGYILSQNYRGDEKEKVVEHRIFQQFINREKIGRVHIQNRYRFEQRFIEEDYRMRFRYFMGFNIPFNSKVMAPKAVYLSLYNEIFLNLDSPVFDRNRAYGALGYVLRSGLRVEAGYMYQIYERTNRSQFQLAVFNSIPFRN